MKRCVVKYKDGFCNIPATMICREDAIVYVFSGTDLVGIFDLGFLICRNRCSEKEDNQ